MKKIIRLTESDLNRIVRKVIMEEQINSCKDLIPIPKQGSELKGAISQGYIGEQGWEEKIKKAVTHTKFYQFNGHPSVALRMVSKCSPSKKGVDYVEFSKNGEYITYIGVD